MKSRLTKVLCLVMCALLLVTGSVFLTLAFLSSTSETVTNTFTVGNVTITLDEAKVDLYGVEEEGADRVTANDYKLIPGQTYKKDPVITVKEGSEPAYVYLGLAIDPAVAAVIDGSIASQLATNGWLRLQTGGTDTVWTDSDDTTYDIYYKANAVDASDGDETVKTFETFKVITDPSDAKLNAANAKTIKVKAFAVQSANTDSVEAAWLSAFPQVND